MSSSRIVSNQSGFSLVELMVVVSIVGILAGTAVTSMDTSGGTQVAAEKMGQTLRMLSRRAIASGPLRPDVALATGARARTRMRIFWEGDRQVAVSEEAVESPRPQANVTWVETSRTRLPESIEIDSFALVAASSQGVSSTPLTGVLEIQCFANGACDAVTLFFHNLRSDEQHRLVIMPLNGAPEVFSGW